MSAGTVSAEVGFGTLDYEGDPVIRFLRGMHLWGRLHTLKGKHWLNMRLKLELRFQQIVNLALVVHAWSHC